MAGLEDPVNVLLGGELGDAIYALPTVKSLGKANLLVTNRPWYRPDWVSRSDALKPLALVQPYVTSFKPHQGEEIDLDLTGYRSLGWRYAHTIADRIATWARVKADYVSPWLEAEPSPATKGKIIVARCPRWLGLQFPWKALVQTFRKDMLFLGTDEEYRAFCVNAGVVVERLRTANLLEVAQAIAGSELFIGNQSAPNAIAEGLKHRSIAEACPTAFDCLYPRDNSIHFISGSLSFAACGKTFSSEPVRLKRGFKILVGPEEIHGATAFDCEVMGRAEYVRQGLPLPSIAEIRSQMRPIVP